MLKIINFASYLLLMYVCICEQTILNYIILVISLNEIMNNATL